MPRRVFGVGLLEHFVNGVQVIIKMFACIDIRTLKCPLFERVAQPLLEAMYLKPSRVKKFGYSANGSTFAGGINLGFGNPISDIGFLTTHLRSIPRWNHARSVVPDCQTESLAVRYTVDG